MFKLQALKAGWDLFQNEILGMKGLHRLIGRAVEAMAAAESLDAHKNAMTVRLKEISGKC